MRNKYVFVFVMLLCILAGSMGLTTLYVSGNRQSAENNEITIVTSFYPMYIAALNVVGDTEGITLENLSEPQTGCLHDFQLTPEDMKLLSSADIFVVNGGGIESFLEDVADSCPKLTLVQASEDVPLLNENESEDVHEHTHDEDATGHGEEEEHSEEEEHGGEEEHGDEEEHSEEADSHGHSHDGEANAHAWMSIANYRIQVATIAEHLAELDPVHADSYLENAGIYDRKLAELQSDQEALREKISGTKIIIFHEAFAYIAEEYQLEVCYTLDLDEERQVSAGEVADVLTAIRTKEVPFILAEELYGSSMGDTVTAESDVQVIYLDPLTRGDYDADSYLDGMRNNIAILSQVCIGSE